jgi:hypothetical protein
MPGEYLKIVKITFWKRKNEALTGKGEKIQDDRKVTQPIFKIFIDGCNSLQFHWINRHAHTTCFKFSLHLK